MKKAKLPTQRDGSILAAFHREISLHVRTPVSKKVYRRSIERKSIQTYSDTKE